MINLTMASHKIAEKTGINEGDLLDLTNRFAQSELVVEEHIPQLVALSTDIVKDGHADSKTLNDALLNFLKNPSAGTAGLDELNIGHGISQEVVQKMADLYAKGSIGEAQGLFLEALAKKNSGKAHAALTEYNNSRSADSDLISLIHEKNNIQNPVKGFGGNAFLTLEQFQSKLEKDIKEKLDPKYDEQGNSMDNSPYNLEELKILSDEVRKILEHQKEAEQKLLQRKNEEEQIVQKRILRENQNENEEKTKAKESKPIAGESCLCSEGKLSLLTKDDLESIELRCSCCDKDKPESPVETDSPASKAKPDATSGKPLSGAMPIGKGKGGTLASGIFPMENDPVQGLGLGGFNLSEIFNGGIGDLLGNFEELGSKASSIFKDMGFDLSSIFKDGEFALDGLFGKLDGLFKDGPFGDLLGGLFGGKGGGFDLSGLFGGGGGGIFDSLLSGVSSLFSGGGGSFFDSIISGVGSFFGGLFHDGGIVGTAVPGRMVPAALFAGAPKFHSGGWLGPGERPIIAQEGELILNAAQQKNLAGRMNGGVNVSVPVIVENHSNEKVQTREESGPDGKKQIRMFIGEVVNGGIASGQFDKSMNRAYGLSRRGY